MSAKIKRKDLKTVGIYIDPDELAIIKEATGVDSNGTAILAAARLYVKSQKLLTKENDRDDR